MNKKFKIATVAVSVVMAGTMAFGMFGCNKSDGPSFDYKPSVDADGKLTYAQGTQLNVDIIADATVDRKISYDASQIASEWKGLDGETVRVGDLKPAWRQFGQTLGITFKDTAVGGRKGTELSKAISEGDVGQHNFINASASEIMGNTDVLLDINQYIEYLPNYAAFLDQNPIVKYSLTMDTNNGAMYYIPYFDGNDDIEKYDLVQRQWVRAVLNDTTPLVDNTDSTKVVTFKTQAVAKGLAGTSTSAVSFMGTTAADNWVVETTKPGVLDNNSDADDLDTIWVKCDYGKALDAAKETGSGLNTALKAAWADLDVTTLASGNIVDLQNAVINGKQGEVTGAQLATILREYIKVAYYRGDTKAAAETSTTAMYSASNLADVFNSTSAAWDADLMTAMFRCVVTNYDKFPGIVTTGDKAITADHVWALAGREMKAQRENDLIALAGELYGVRGMESRLDYVYIDHNGALADARTNVKSYEAAAKLYDLAKEGLLFNKVSDTSSTIGKLYPFADKVTDLTFMIHDYVQTQTTDGFNNKADWTGTTSADVFKFDFAPILTAVSRWDTNDDAGAVNGDGAETVMRFTESWRSVKNSGVCIPKASIKNGDQLSAILKFIDYLYSNDGQIVGSYGTKASGKTASDGYWYGDLVSATIGGVTVTDGVGDLAALKAAGVVDTADEGVQYYIANTEANKENRKKYFMYGNKIYRGTPYKDRNIPTMTDNNLTFYHGGEVGKTSEGGSGKMDTANTTGIKKSYKNNYTNYARGIIGSALPIGNKDQGFEYQGTAPCGLEGSAVVAAALNNGTIKHVTQKIDNSNLWYTEAPTVLPVTSEQGDAISAQLYLDGKGKTTEGLFNPTSDAGVSNVYIDIAFWGFNTSLRIGTNGQTTGSKGWPMQANAAALKDYIVGLNDGGLTTRISYYSQAWGKLRLYYSTSAN